MNSESILFLSCSIASRDVFTETPRTIIARNTSPDLPFDRSVNPYRGCEHGCIYCFARPTHAYLGLSPGLDFETKLTVKPDAARLLRKAFDNPRYAPATLALGTNTDPYQPLEKQYRITRSIIEVLLEHRHPFSITTKSAMVVTRWRPSFPPGCEAERGRQVISRCECRMRLKTCSENGSAHMRRTAKPVSCAIFARRMAAKTMTLNGDIRR